MALVPRKPLELISFYREHSKPTGPWDTNSVAIGTTATAVTGVFTAVGNAQSAYEAQQAAISASRTATLAYRQAILALAVAGADVIKQIKVKGSVDPSVWVLADIPAPATPTPVPPPGQPTDLKVGLAAEGGVILKWKCKNPVGSQGTTYQIYRQTSTTGGMVFLGTTGPRQFTDATVPAGAGQVTYKIVAVRSTAIGPAALFVVNLGVGSTGQMTAAVVAQQGGQPKLAA
jgi:hypothetical protein